MIFDFSEYLHLARELAGERGRTSSCEAKLRSAISRAYYAAYMTSCAKIREEKIEIPNDVTGHEKVSKLLQGSDNINKRLIGEKLERLRRQRNKADYGIRLGNLNKDAAAAILEASNIFFLFDKISTTRAGAIEQDRAKESE